MRSSTVCAAPRQLPAVDTLRAMLQAREIDRREGLLMRQNRGHFQVPSGGHESLAALAALLQPQDMLFPCYRDRALLLAHGATLEEMALDFFALADSESEGRSMPGHYSVRRLNAFSLASPTGAQCLPAVGVAWALQRRGGGALVLCSLGDGASRQGEFFEAVCQAVQESLPVVFLVEDNGYAISTPTEHMLPFRLGVLGGDLVERVDGRNALTLYDAAAPVFARVRSGGGPAVLWCELDRICSHTSADDHRVYRSSEELAAIEARDPLDRLVADLIADGTFATAAWETMQREVEAEVDAVYQRIGATERPDPATVTTHLFGPPVEAPSLPLAPQPDTTMVAAINGTLEAALEHWPEMLMFGQDIADPKGGVFGFTKGLSTRFPGRIINSPLAEATIVGTAVGLAAMGMKPVFEIQFVDFLSPGFHQLATQVTTLRWRSAGRWSCPLVLYAPYGAYLPGGGMWHSQSNEGWWTHLPGLRVAVPSNAADAAGLFWSAIAGQDPTLILLPKHLCRQRQSVERFEPVPFGRAVRRRTGDDVTLVAWGNAVEVVDEAAILLEAEGISAEVIDLRSLVPCDWRTIEESLARTGRLVVVQEDSKTSSFGQAIVSEMLTVPDRFDLFLAAPQLVSRPDLPIPFHPDLELAILPRPETVAEAARLTMA